MLKSVENEDKAIRLMKDVKSMCQEGGFNLTKFASNSKRVLRSIPEKDRKVVSRMIYWKAYQKKKH